jgi:hypothetical protein
MRILTLLAMILLVITIVAVIGTIITGQGLLTSEPTQESRSWALVALLVSITNVFCIFICLALNKYPRKKEAKNEKISR